MIIPHHFWQEDPVKYRLLCPNCGSRRLKRMWFGYPMFPFTVKKDSLGRDRAKMDDALHTLDRTRHGGCCVDIWDTFECARCECHITLRMEFDSNDEMVPKLSVYGSPDED